MARCPKGRSEGAAGKDRGRRPILGCGTRGPCLRSSRSGKGSALPSPNTPCTSIGPAQHHVYSAVKCNTQPFFFFFFLF